MVCAAQRSYVCQYTGWSLGRVMLSMCYGYRGHVGEGIGLMSVFGSKSTYFPRVKLTSGKYSLLP